MDIFNIPNTNLNNQVFFTNGDTNWQIWQKPKNCKFVNMFLIGGGGGGGSGYGSSSAVNTSGGSGGGSSSITIGFFPSNLLPDLLYIRVGVGGLGGTSVTSGNGTSGSAGGTSYISISPTATTSNIILASVGGSGGGGGVLGSSSVGAGGSAFSRILGSSTGILNYLGVVKSVSGETSASNTTLVNGPDVSLSYPISAGAGGGGTQSTSGSFAGGSILSNGIIPQISGGAAGGNDGNQGFSNMTPSLNSSLQFPPYFTGGGGGGGTVLLAVAGNGGNGSYGSGGGGGGSIYKSVTPRSSGAGGRGGNGLVIINCW
jgi:hypothetical protein